MKNGPLSSPNNRTQLGYLPKKNKNFVFMLGNDLIASKEEKDFLFQQDKIKDFKEKNKNSDIIDNTTAESPLFKFNNKSVSKRSPR